MTDEQVEALRDAFEKGISVGTDRPMRSKKGAYLSSYIVERWRGFQAGAAHQATLSPDVSGVIAKIEAIAKDLLGQTATTKDFDHILTGRVIAHRTDLDLLRSLPSSQRLARLERFAETVREITKNGTLSHMELHHAVMAVNGALAELDKEGEK